LKNPSLHIVPNAVVVDVDSEQGGIVDPGVRFRRGKTWPLMVSGSADTVINSPKESRKNGKNR